MLKKPEIVMFKDPNSGRVFAGKVTYNDNWFNEWKKGNETAILEIEFKEDDVPESLSKEQVPEVVNYANEDFQNKIGMTWEEFCKEGCPGYEDIKFQVDKILQEKALEKIRERRINMSVDIEEAKKELESLKKKLDEVSKKEKKNGQR